MTSDLGLTPVNDGKVIRLTMPTPTEERRKQLAKQVHKIAEDTRVAIRNIRREANDTLKAMCKDKKVPEDEVSMLMSLLEEAIYRELPDLMARNVRLRVIGRPGGVPLPIRRGIDRVVEATRDNTGLTLVMAFNYGGRDELLEAVRALAVRVQAGELAPAAISEADVSAALYTRDIPDPDLLIRTSGEMRVANFLLC